MCPAHRCASAAVRETVARWAARWAGLAIVVVGMAGLTACGEDEPQDVAGNSAPTISGSAPGIAQVGVAYSFQPSASDADGDVLSFGATGLPPWASINPSTGRISGTPHAGEEGSYPQIRVTVSDGEHDAALAPFAVTVWQSASGSALLSWFPPTTNADGTAMSDLAGYRIEFGRTAGAPDQSVHIDNPSINSFLIEGLAPGTWHFAIVALNAARVESPKANLGSKTI